MELKLSLSSASLFLLTSPWPKKCKFIYYHKLWHDTAWYILSIRRKLEIVFSGAFMLFLSCFFFYFRARLFIDALWSPAGKGLTSWLLFLMSNCEVVTFSLVSWVRCGARLHRFLIFAVFLTFRTNHWWYIKKSDVENLKNSFFISWTMKFLKNLGSPNYFAFMRAKFNPTPIDVTHNSKSSGITISVVLMMPFY